jgi:hypothetical protein
MVARNARYAIAALLAVLLAGVVSYLLNKLGF